MNPVSIIIPSRNPFNLQECLRAVCGLGDRYDGDGVRILPRTIVIDDASETPGIANVCEHYQSRRIVGVKPFVFARNINLGIQAAGTDVILLNDDALLQTQDGFERLAEAQQAHPECGLMSAATNGGAFCQRREPGAQVRYDNVMVAFVCVFIPRSTIDLLGLLDERFGLKAEGTGPRGYGCDDDDYCWRVRGAGLKLGIYDGCYVDHRTLKSTFRGDPERPADVLIHEDLFRQKWGRHPRLP